MAEEFIAGKTKTGSPVIIHLIHAAPEGKIKTQCFNDTAQGGVVNKPGGVFDIACCPGSGLPAMASSVAAAVTCPKCKETAVFKALQAGASRQGDSDNNGSAADQAIQEYLATSAQK